MIKDVLRGESGFATLAGGSPADCRADYVSVSGASATSLIQNAVTENTG
jgi:hypothetical protein